MLKAGEIDLLSSTVFPVMETGGGNAGGTSMLSLPEVLEALGSDRVEYFPGLQAHQMQAWYQFLAQTGAMARRGAPGKKPGAAAAAAKTWKKRLRALAGGSPTGWMLTAEPGNPAFLQAPTRRIDEFKLKAETPDRLDVLWTAKNHDRKRGQMRGAEAYHWIYALLTLQTTQGYGGRGNPGIMRMNGGHGARVLVDRRPSGGWGARFLRALDRLAGCGDSGAYAPEDRLLWLQPWDDEESLESKKLDPLAVEICRRIRLDPEPDGPELAAFGLSASDPRCDGRNRGGLVGDPWTPADVRKGKRIALTPPQTGFDYRTAVRILFRPDETEAAPALESLKGEDDADTEVHMMVRVGGQGQTSGLHERVIPIPPTKGLGWPFEAGAEKSALGGTAQAMVKTASDGRWIVKRGATAAVHGPDRDDRDKHDADGEIAEYDREVDRMFFTFLFDPANGAGTAFEKAWKARLETEIRRLTLDRWTREAKTGRAGENRKAAAAIVEARLRKFRDGRAEPAGKAA